MANLHSNFRNFEERISLTITQQNTIVSRHNTIRTVITEYFKKKDGIRVPNFFIQGSYKMKTMVQKKDGSFDVDLGIYFPEKPIVTPTTLQSYVFEAVKYQTYNGTQHLKKCIRINYSGEFNIDLPVYYQINTYTQAYIAVKNNDWIKDDPEKFINWVDDKRNTKELNKDGQLLRIIKYFKRWANLLPFKTPSGVALTVWVCNNFSPSKDRDDEAFIQTLSNINNSFWFSISCNCPVEPYDDLLNNLDSNQKNKFKESLSMLLGDAIKAYNTTDNNIAISLFSKHLGDKFK